MNIEQINKASEDNNQVKYNQTQYDRIATLTLDMGAALLATGAASIRVEDAITRIGLAYGAKSVDVFSITSMILVTLHMKDDSSVTQIRRVGAYSFDMDKLERLNALSRQICDAPLTIEEVQAQIGHILTDRPTYSRKMFLGYILASAAFAIFFGGNWLDALVAGVISVFLYLVDWNLKKKSKNKIVYTFLTSLGTGALVMLCVLAGLPIHRDKVMIGLIMLLIPGTQLMNSVKDMLCGDTMTGMLRLIESILLAVAIATGFAVAILLL